MYYGSRGFRVRARGGVVADVLTKRARVRAREGRSEGSSAGMGIAAMVTCHKRGFEVGLLPTTRPATQTR